MQLLHESLAAPRCASLVDALNLNYQ